MSTQPGAGLVSNTGNTPSGDAKPALNVVRRWNDGVQRHTLFTACGTQQDGWGIYNDPGTPQARQDLLNLANAVFRAGGLPEKTLADMPADGASAAALGLSSPESTVALRLNQNLWNWVPVSYPASFPGAPANLDNGWQPSTISFADSVTIGTNNMINLIKATPGTFALCGMSQGAMVISNVLKAMQPGGTLANRAGDCIAGVAFGNPMRKQGASMPGVQGAPGAGMFSLKNSIGAVSGLAPIATPPWWWEMCTPGDFFADAPMASNGGIAGTLFSRIASAAVTIKGTNVKNPVELPLKFLVLLGQSVSTLLTAARSSTNVPALRTIGLWFRDLGFLGGIQPLLTGDQGQVIIGNLILNIVKSLFKLTDSDLAQLNGNFPNGNPHMFYGVWKPPSLPSGLSGVDGSSTYVDVAVAYLNQVGATVAPRGNSVRAL